MQLPQGAVETVDLGGTATLTLTLPNGFTFTSASGVLLSQVRGKTAAPEPSSLAILVTALAAVGWSASRARRDHGNRQSQRRAAREYAGIASILLAERRPISLAGDALVVIDSSQ